MGKKNNDNIADNQDLPNEEQMEAGVETPENTDTPEGRIEKLELEKSELNDKFLRLFAEFDNYKKRTRREKLDLMATAAQDTLSALLPVLDDFDRAKKVSDSPDSEENFPEGVTLVYNKLKSAMENLGLTQMETNGEVFNPELHEAITEIPAPTPELQGKIVDTIEAGYLLKDKIIRFPKVVVGK